MLFRSQHSGLQGLESRAQEETQPLPVHEYELCSEGVEGFRMLQRAGQIGKVVLSLDNAADIHSSSSSVDFIGCMQVTGGTGGLGLLFGQWLAESLVWSPVLLSRSGRLGQGAEQHWHSLSGSPRTAASVRLCDMASCREAQQVMEYGTRGLVHSAGVLADALLLNQTQAGLQWVWTPKAEAAWSLHRGKIGRAHV